MEHPNATFPSALVPMIECGLLALMVLAATFFRQRPAFDRAFSRLFDATGWLSALAGRLRTNAGLVTAAGVLGLLGSAAISAWYGFPVLGTDDAGAYLVTGETFAAGRLVNPPAPHPALVREHVLGEPVYTGKYPPGQGMMLAIGYLLGHPGLALWISAALLAMSLTWCLLGWLPRRWALLGAVLVLLRLAVGGYWNHSYWGGSVAAIAGALLFGGLGRHFGGSDGRPRSLPALAFGLGLLAITRPWEGFLVAAPVLIWLVCWWFGRLAKQPAVALRSGLLLALIGGTTLAFIGHYNYRTTGSMTRFAHQQYKIDRPMPGEFVWHRWIDSEGRMSLVDADVPMAERRGWWKKSLPNLYHRAMQSGYFLIGPSLLLSLLLTLPGLWVTWRYRLLLICIVVTICGHSIVHFYFPHYSAPMTAPFLVLGLAGLRQLSLRPPPWFRQGSVLVASVLLIESVSFVFQLPALRHDPSEYWMRQPPIQRQLEGQGGKHLILIDPHSAEVFNYRDLAAPVLWAADLGAESTAELLTLFPDREHWAFDPNARPQLESLEAAGGTAIGRGKVQ